MFSMNKRVESGILTVSFYVHADVVNVITTASWSVAGHTAFTYSKEEARAEWKRLAAAGFVRA